MGESSPISLFSIIHGVTSHFSTRANIVIGQVVVIFAICTRGADTRTILGSKGRLSKERNMVVRIDWLTMSLSKTDSSVFFKNAVENYVRVETRKVGHVLDGLLEVDGFIRHHV